MNSGPRTMSYSRLKKVYGPNNLSTGHVASSGYQALALLGFAALGTWSGLFLLLTSRGQQTQNNDTQEDKDPT